MCWVCVRILGYLSSLFTLCWGYVGAGTKQGCRFIHIANSGKYWQKLVFQYSEVFNIQDTDTNILSWLIPTSGVPHKLVAIKVAIRINCWLLISVPFC